MSRPFYYNDSVRLHVHNSKTLSLRLEDFTGERDTGFIRLPCTYYSDARREKFRFYTVLNYSEYDGNEFGLWIYSYHPSFNYKIQGCTFHVIKGLNTVVLPPTTTSDSVVGTYRSPCYEIVNNAAILDFFIYFPNMTFQTDVSGRIVQSDENNGGVARPQGSTAGPKLKVVNLSNEISASFKKMMKETDYDVHFLVDGKKIGSFKFVLCAVSEVFRAAFTQKYTKESRSGEIIIYDFDHNIVQMFVDALHTHKIIFNADPVTTLQLGMLANKYNVTCIEKAALDAFDVMDVNRYNFVDAFRLAIYDNEIMGRLMKRFIEMRVDTKDIVGFDELPDKTKIDLYRSAHRTSIGK